MTAVLALDGDRVVGIIPFEQRDIVGRDGRIVKALWVSGAHVDEQYRSHGLGSRMDLATGELFPDAECILVCRGDPQSGAYRWYKKNGYDDVVQVVSLKAGVMAAAAQGAVLYCDTLEAIDENAERLHECFWRHNGRYCGFVHRDQPFWRKKWLYQYYRDFYRFSVLALTQDGGMAAYAFLGETDMRDGVRRFDLLELAVPENQTVRESLLAAVMNTAVKKGLSELRLQVAGTDPIRAWFEAKGFRQRPWDSRILGRTTRAADSLARYFDIVRWRYFHVDHA